MSSMKFKQTTSSKSIKTLPSNQTSKSSLKKNGLKEKGNDIIERIDDLLTLYKDGKNQKQSQSQSQNQMMNMNFERILKNSKEITSNTDLSLIKVKEYKKQDIFPEIIKNSNEILEKNENKRRKTTERLKKQSKKAFMTDVIKNNLMNKDSISIEFSSKEGVTKKINEKVKDMFSLIDDSFYEKEYESSVSKDENNKKRKNKPSDFIIKANDNEKVIEDKEFFQSMMKQIEEIKRKKEEEENEIQKLIRITKKTSQNLDRHFVGMSRLYKEANIERNSKVSYDIHDDDKSSDENEENRKKNQEGYDDGFYSKDIEKIKDRLLNVTTGVINYHSDLSSLISKMKESNKTHMKDLIKKSN